MKKIILLLLAGILLIPSLLSATTSIEIIERKVQDVSGDILRARNKSKKRYKKYKVAVMPFASASSSANEKKFGYLFSEYLAQYLIDETSVFSLVERKNMKEVLDEISQSTSSDLFDQENSVQIGKLSGAHFLILGNVVEVQSEKNKKIMHINVKMVSTENGEIVMNKIFPLSKKVASKVSKLYQYNDKTKQRYQISFDLQDRLYLGALWSPMVKEGQSLTANHFTFNFGYNTFLFNDVNTNRYRFKALDGEISLNPFNFDISLFEFDFANNQEKPLFWLTTFLGEPRRYDTNLKLGFKTKIGRVQYHPLGSENYVNIEAVNALLAVNFYQSKDMINFFRLKMGPGFGVLFSDDSPNDMQYNFLAKAGLEGKFILDSWGRHMLSLDVEGTIPFNTADKWKSSFYGEASIGYEMVFMAISDEPVSLVAKLSGQYREDIPDRKSKWAANFSLGLNFSLGTPPLEKVLDEKQLRKEINLNEF